ncbi:hypothetical protein IW148_002493 [Coemansia sp. RSA 1199]|nr:hypothetical protein IW148_002493 [Coemansia sp. RSA 1199]
MTVFGTGILFYVNGTQVTIDDVDLDMTLLQYLRSTGLTGTKLGCGEGGCGACTVMVSTYNVDLGRPTHATANACLYPLYAMDGKHVVTVEGLGSAKHPHPVQQRIALLHGSQCGFCTPGFVMSLYTLLRNNPNPSELDIEECFDGNLCRCTGYRPILDAAKTFANDAWKAGANVGKDGIARAPETESKGCGIEGCCQTKKAFSLPDPARVNGVSEASDCAKTSEGCCKGAKGSEGCCKTKDANWALVEKSEAVAKFRAYDATQEPIFPPFLARYVRGETEPTEAQRRELHLRTTQDDAQCTQVFRPLTLDSLLAIVKEHPTAKLVAGNSEVGVEIKFKRTQFATQVYVGDVPELRTVERCADGVEFGVNITLARFGHELQTLSRELPEQSQCYAALLEALRFFAGNQIRNVATVAGNIATASPISDLNPVFLATGSVLTLVSASGSRRVPISEFFLGYRRTALAQGEILHKVFVPHSRPREIVRAFKQAKRKDDDIAIVTCAMRVRVDDAGRVEEAAYAFGGMAPTTVLAKSVGAASVGTAWGDAALLGQLVAACHAELQLAYTVPGGMAEYRTALACSFVRKFWTLSCAALGSGDIEPHVASEMEEDARTVSHGQQAYERVSDRAIVGHGVAHVSALQQTTGEARYIDDMPAVGAELHMALVPSAHPHAHVLKVDSTEALGMAGVKCVLTHEDVPGSNIWNIFRDEELLPSRTVHHVGQPVALVVAATQRQAQAAAQRVHVTYEVLPAVLTVRDAVAQGALFAEERKLVRGDVDAALAASDVTLSGTSYCGAQEHFYLETMGAVAVPRGENGEMDLYASTQNPTEVQMVCAEALGVPAARIVCHVKRMGGGFGGKESRSVLVSTLAALGAQHTGRSVRLVLDRDVDMQISGQRHPFYATWTVGATRTGELRALRMRLYSNGGFSHDLSLGVLERAVSHVDNCYRLGATDIVGRVCRTNTQSNTAFRSFGGCQGMLMTESMLCELADHINVPIEHIRRINMYNAGDVTPFSQPLVAADWNVPRMWDQLEREASVVARRAEIEEFNRTTQFRKRGLAMVPTKFGISFGVKHLNQGMSLVHVYMDGSVLVAHGGTEMGQGLHTKMAQIAAETLEVPLSTIFISETATNTAANTSPTAASASSDLNGYAVYNACKVLADRLRPYRERMHDASFAAIAKAAYLDRVQLSEAGHYATPDIGFSWAENSGLLYFYFTQGVALAEVELDVLTGSHTTRRVDIIMDVGRSLNKAIDIGQIEGAFAQGQGWCTTEEFLYSPATGRLLTQGPGNYKIPSALDIPRDLRVSLMEPEQPNALKTIFSSKGIGEPPLFLGASVFFALRDAVMAARKDNGVERPLHMECPATAEVLRMACEDDIVELTRIPHGQRQGVPFAVRI